METRQKPIMTLKKYGVFLLLAGLVGCTHQTRFGTSAGHVGAEQDNQQKTAPAGDIPKPVKKLAYVPPPKPKVKEPTYSVVVSSVPVQEILFALARESKLNIDIHPAVRGNVTLNAVDQTLPAILDRLGKQIDVRYRVENNVIFISPDLPALRTYKINYVNMDRDTTSSIGVSAQVGNTASSTTGNTSSSGENKSATKVTTTSKNNFWTVLDENIRHILKSTKSQTASAEDKAARNEAQRLAQEERLKQVEAASKAGAGAEKLFQEAFKPQASAADTSKDDVIVNPVAGTVTVMATDKQHNLIQQYIDAVTAAAQRQVLIEATIVEVGLTDEFKSGVNWSKLAKDGSNTGLTFGFGKTNATNLTTAGTSDDFVVNFIRSTSLGSLATSIKLLEKFGTTKVLSSPKLMALNNQTSILKVVENLVYFSVEANTTTSTNGPAVTTFTTTANTVPVGLVMSVTPQISETGKITLMVRPTISRKVGDVPDPNPSIPAAIGNRVPVIQAREMESVLQMDSGETAILGGLMQDDISKSSSAVPKAGQLPVVGNLFKSKDDAATKTELVIFLRATTVSDPSLESRELSAFKQYLPENQFPVAADEPVN